MDFGFKMIKTLIIAGIGLIASPNLWASDASESREILALLSNQIDADTRQIPDHAIHRIDGFAEHDLIIFWTDGPTPKIGDQLYVVSRNVAYSPQIEASIPLQMQDNEPDRFRFMRFWPRPTCGYNDGLIAMLTDFEMGGSGSTARQWYVWYNRYEDRYEIDEGMSLVKLIPEPCMK
jgi:hypothetical protein